MTISSNGILALENGVIFRGKFIGEKQNIHGEIIFNTAYTGYQEVLTDPSYAHQIILFTTPHVGITGCNSYDNESEHIWARGCVMNELEIHSQHFLSNESLYSFLKRQKISILYNIDTRYLTRIIREEGCIRACISPEINKPSKLVEIAKTYSKDATPKIIKDISNQRAKLIYQDSLVKRKNIHVAVIDYGIKENILKNLHAQGYQITRLPASSRAKDILAIKPDAIVLSNGPGDPRECKQIIREARHLIDSNIPILGICFGHQIIGLALGGSIEKMSTGHHGSNHPILYNDKVYITSQNHNYTLNIDAIKTEVTITATSLFDNSTQGISHNTLPVIGFQGHPEASPGPHDLLCVFEQFNHLIKEKSKVDYA